MACGESARYLPQRPASAIYLNVSCMNARTKLLIASLALLCIFRAADATSVIDFQVVEFQDGRPAPTSTLEDSVKPPAERELSILEEAADALRRYPKLTIAIAGFTDDQECADTGSCKGLSRRRAKLVYAWLLVHGVLSTQVTSVEGIGDQPVDFNDYEGGRQRNRRVEIRNTRFDKP